MDSVNKPSANPASICRVQIAKLSDVASIAYIKMFAAVVNFNPDCNWNDIYGTPASFRFTEKAQKADAGMSYLLELKLQYPGQDPQVYQSFMDVENQPVLAAIHYSDDTVKIIGSIHTPAILTIDHNAGNETIQIISITCNSLDRSMWLYPDIQSVP